MIIIFWDLKIAKIVNKMSFGVEHIEIISKVKIIVMVINFKKKLLLLCNN